MLMVEVKSVSSKSNLGSLWKSLWKQMSKSNCAIERALSSTAKKFQTPPASTISVERLFSVGGNVLDDKRKKLKAKSVSRLMFSREAMRALKYNY